MARSEKKPEKDLKKESSSDGSDGDHEVLTTTVSANEEISRKEGIRPIFYAKVCVLNRAIAEVGMGKYQWKLFASAGGGWFADNIWLQGVAIIMPSVANEEGWQPYPQVRLATLALYVGLIVGATFWGMSCDVIGRRLAWNSTLVIGGIFGIATGAATSFTAFCALISVIGFGVGGNLPVDGALFLEFLPGPQQYLLTLLSIFWAVGQVVASLICWVFIERYSCDATLVGVVEGYACTAANNSGWRYSYFTLGALMLFLSAVRAFFIPMDESPKFLISIGRDAEAVAVIHNIARVNGTTSTLTVEDLHAAAEPYFRKEGDGAQATTAFSTIGLIKHSLDDISGEHLKGLFATPRLAYSTSLIIFIYASLGLAYPLYNAFLGTYLESRFAALGDTSTSATYSAYTYQAACGVIGSILAAIMVQWKRGGRKWAMAFWTLLTGAFLFILTATTTGPQINALTCLAALSGNAFYGIIYAYAPECFPSPHRGTGDALAAASSRVAGLFAPIIAIYSSASRTPNGPVYAAAAIFLMTGLSMFGLPIETVGVTAL